MFHPQIAKKFSSFFLKKLDFVQTSLTTETKVMNWFGENQC